MPIIHEAKPRLPTSAAVRSRHSICWRVSRPISYPAADAHPDLCHDHAGDRVAVASDNADEGALSHCEPRRAGLGVVVELCPARPLDQLPVIPRADGDLVALLYRELDDVLGLHVLMGEDRLRIADCEGPAGFSGAVVGAAARPLSMANRS